MYYLSGDTIVLYSISFHKLVPNAPQNVLMVIIYQVLIWEDNIYIWDV